jgi:hypothetical protein
MAGGRAAKNVVSRLINRFRRARFQADQIVEGNIVQVELEIRTVARYIHGDRGENARRQQHAIDIVIAGERTGVHVPAHLQQRQNFIGTNEKRGADAAVRHDYRPGVSTQESDQARGDLADRTLHPSVVHHVVGDAEAENYAHVLVARRVAHPEITHRTVGVNPVSRLLTLNSSGVGRVQRNQTTREQIRSSDVEQRFDSRDRLFDVVQRVWGLGDLITERLSGQIVSGPDGRIAAAGVADDLITGGSREDRVENGSVGKMRRENVRRNGERVRFGRLRSEGEGGDRKSRSRPGDNAPPHRSLAVSLPGTRRAAQPFHRRPRQAPDGGGAGAGTLRKGERR